MRRLVKLRNLKEKSEGGRSRHARRCASSLTRSQPRLCVHISPGQEGGEFRTRSLPNREPKCSHIFPSDTSEEGVGSVTLSIPCLLSVMLLFGRTGGYSPKGEEEEEGEEEGGGVYKWSCDPERVGVTFTGKTY
ncbi:hypothetical protein CgunFtcFv8_025105 [Champsocephalus gunnari]|uniref:Uncharacterized protein n=1 Tax=Champsocephalus gunnari TaxID=52237 RepID=A0AAN8HMJ1_CHAGU|nr:hypothetical protein CgunFtcFv8_025105 [Champsocephalus gunnari]